MTNAIKALLQMTSGFLQLESTLESFDRKIRTPLSKQNVLENSLTFA
jgi:hypothetical protein